MPSAMNLKTVIVIGATGLVGHELVIKLIKDETIGKVVTLSRSKIKVVSPKIESHIINFDDISSYQNLVVGDALFSCLGTTLKQAGSIKAQRKVDLQYQLELATVAANNNVSHLLLVSSSGANADSANAYLKMKGELEIAINKLDFQHIIILRPSLLLGDRTQMRIGEAIAGKILPLLNYLPMLRKYRPIPASTVAQKLITAFKGANKKHQIFELDQVFD